MGRTAHIGYDSDQRHCCDNRGRASGARMVRLVTAGSAARRLKSETALSLIDIGAPPLAAHLLIVFFLVVERHPQAEPAGRKLAGGRQHGEGGDRFVALRQDKLDTRIEEFLFGVQGAGATHERLNAYFQEDRPERWDAAPP